MKYNELTEFMNETEVCIVGAGAFGAGAAYTFMKNMNDRAKYTFFDNNRCEGEEIVDGIKTVSFENIGEVCCIAVNSEKAKAELEEQLANKEKVYTISSWDIFNLCRMIEEEKGELLNKVPGFWKERNYEVQIETTSYCNAKCNFCPNVSLKRKKNIMSDEVFEKILDRIEEEKINVTTFILHLNGEPLIDSKIFDRIRTIKDRFPKGTRVRFTTNFSLADTEIIEKIFECGLDEITCSLNSIDAEEYKDIMGLEYDKTINNIKHLLQSKEEKKSNLKINLSIVETKDNKNEVELFRKMYGDKANIRVMQLGEWVGSNSQVEKNNSKNKGVCSILYRTVNILSNGNYALCCFDAEGIIGKNIMDTSIKEAWKTGVYDEIRQYHLKNGRSNRECMNCSFS